MVGVGDVDESLRLYAKALVEREIFFASEVAVGPRGPGWGSPSGRPDTLLLGVPGPLLGKSSEHSLHYGWCKALITFQCGHVEFGHVGDSDVAEVSALEDPIFARAILTLLEDTRIDHGIRRTYQGLWPEYLAAIARIGRAGVGAPIPGTRQGFLEMLLQLSLHPTGAVLVEDELEALRPAALDVLESVRVPSATTTASVDGMLRLYDLCRDLQVVDDEAPPLGEPRLDDGERPPGTAEPRDPEEELPLRSAPPGEDMEDPDSTEEGAEGADDADDPVDATAQPELSSDAGQGPLQGRDRHSRVYPEWDFRQGAYRPAWCRVRFLTHDEGDGEFYRSTVFEYGWLVHQIRSKFEQLLPDMYRLASRQRDGEDLDLDAVVSYLVDLKAGVTPSELVYRRRIRLQRDVAVLILLDMSATTNEQVAASDAHAVRPAEISAAAYSDYLATIARGVSDEGKALRKRIIDIERQAAILLMHGLEAVGDRYSVYTFTGTGRRNVEVGLVKDFKDRLGDHVLRRFDSISPGHATRMGAAIRHVTHVLRRVTAKTRILCVVSDGRPYDKDYGRGDDDDLYPLHDTRKALLEAKEHHIQPFCITVDREGEDYLKDMCEGIPYEVVADVEDLPMRLLALYPELV